MNSSFKRKIVTICFVSIIVSLKLNAQDSSYHMQPSALAVAEARFAFVSLPEDFIEEKKTVNEGKWKGLGFSFHTNLLVYPNEYKRFRQADYIGLSGGVGYSRDKWWLNGRIDLGWQMHYAINREADFGMRVYGMMAWDKIGFNGVMIHPSFRIWGIYIDLLVGMPVGYPKDLGRNYAEGNLRFLFPNDSKTATDRWYVGFKTIYTKGINFDNSRTDAVLSQFHITGGLML